MKPVRGLLLTKEQRPLKIAPMDFEVGIPLAHQPMEPLPNLMLEPLNTTVLTSSSDSNLRPFSAFLKRLYIWKSHNDRFGMDSGWPNTFKRMESSMPWTVQATRGPPL